MKIDLKRLEGRELRTKAAEESKSVWEAYGCGDQSRDYRWIKVAAASVAIGGICAAISWNALLTFLGVAGTAIVLLGGAVAWIDSDATRFD